MIQIAERLCPFSHEPGTRCLIPTTPFVVEAFPSLLRIYDFAGTLVKEYPLDIKGPLKQFTVMQDLEKGCVTIFSEQATFHLLPDLNLVLTKNPHLPPLENRERLSLGSHKKQEWERIRRGRDFFALFPIWFRLGSLLALTPRLGDDRGLFRLLRECESSIASNRPETILPAFERLFLAGFESLMIPRDSDTDFQAILPLDEPASVDSPLYLLTEGARLIRSLFVVQTGKEISLLPHLPPQFFAGRIVDFRSTYGLIDLEWTKKSLRQLHFRASCDGEVHFHFSPELKQCRLRQERSDPGSLFTCGDSLAIKSGSHYLLDRFQK